MQDIQFVNNFISDKLYNIQNLNQTRYQYNQSRFIKMSIYSNSRNNFHSSTHNPQNGIFTNKKLNLTQQRLWQPSQTSINYVSPRLSFNKQMRFKLHSIYWPQNLEIQNSFVRLNKQRSDMDVMAKKISKKIDQQQKNQIRIKRKASTSQHQHKIRITFSESSKKKNQKLSSQRKRFNLDKKNEEILKRLIVESPRKQSLLRDRHGFRCNLAQSENENLYNVVKDQLQTMGVSNGFKTSAKRLNLNLPHNYYPGPGSYQIKRYLEQLQDKNRARFVKTARQFSFEKRLEI